ncbi:MAG: DUF4142 domain-containing protein [Phenylobacterium sp.]|nr:DUF4142 domain-containing protein [Phenylobacterium sp.]
MKTFALFAAAAATALTLAACQKKDAQPDPADPGTSNEAVNAVQDATAAAVGAVAANTIGQVSTDDFVTNAAISDMYEIEAGKIASTKGRSADVKAFGKMMVADHTRMANDMKPLVSAAGKTPPTGLDERRKGMIDNLNAAKPEDFDNAYLSQQEAAHSEALDLMKGYADKGDDIGLKGAAAKAVPTIQAHLDKVRALQAAGPK